MKIVQAVPEQVSKQFLDRQLLYRDRSKAESEHKIGEKFQALINVSNQSRSVEEPSMNENAILNASTVELPAEVQQLLSLGSKFALPYNNLAEVPMYHLIADVEGVIKTNNDVAIQERTRCSVANQIQNYLHRTKNGGNDAPATKFYQNAEKCTRIFLKAHPEIIVVNADKGNRTVVMEREQYSLKMKSLLEDRKTYQPIPKDLTSKFQNQNNSIVKRLQDLKLIDPFVASKLKTYKAVCPKIYGQPKAHKPGLPLRPVVPCMTAPSYELSKFVSNILQKSLVSKYSIKDSFSFCEYVNSIELPQGYVLVSFDVVALFTSIPKSLVRQSIFRHWDDIKKNTPISLDLFWEITEFCIDSSYFVFEGKYYQQIFGTAMGNPLSPIIAEYVMEDLLYNALGAATVIIPYIKKYVDDLFLALPAEKVDEVLNTFNQQNQHIQFTVEREENGRLPFLDMLLVRQADQTIKTEWYKKAIASGRFLNFHSGHPMSTKMNVAFNLAKRVMLFSTNLSQRNIKTTIFALLRTNDYPPNIINRVINRVCQNQNNGQAMEASRNEENETQTITYCSLTNIHGLTQPITKTLRREYPNIKIASKQHKNVGSLLPIVKDKTPIDERSNVVYKVDCAECDACYIGMTTQKLKARISKHRSNMNKLQTLQRAGYTNRDSAIMELMETTALANHAAREDHSFKLDETKILDTTHKGKNLPILESCHINNTHNTINKRTDTDNLHVAYAGVLHWLRNNQQIGRNRNS